MKLSEYVKTCLEKHNLQYIETCTGIDLPKVQVREMNKDELFTFDLDSVIRTESITYARTVKETKVEFIPCSHLCRKLALKIFP